MTRTVTRLFNSHAEAIAAVSDLEREGFTQAEISLVANNAGGWRAGHAQPLADATRSDGHIHAESHAAEGAGQGATTGGLLGAGGGLLAGLGLLAIPGLGPVVAAGWLVTTAMGAVAGAAIGGAAGGLLGALRDVGHTEEEAHVFAEGVRRGGSLVSVRAADDRASQVEQILARNAGVEAADRGRAYREEGWTQFNADAPAFSAEEMERERNRRPASETRSFEPRHELGGRAGSGGSGEDGPTGDRIFTTPAARGLDY